MTLSAPFQEEIGWLSQKGGKLPPSRYILKLFCLSKLSTLLFLIWPGDTRSQDISSHDIDLVIPEYFIFSTRRVTSILLWFWWCSFGMIMTKVDRLNMPSNQWVNLLCWAVDIGWRIYELHHHRIIWNNQIHGWGKCISLYSCFQSVNLGVCQDGHVVSDIKLPPWAKGR